MATCFRTNSMFASFVLASLLLNNHGAMAAISCGQVVSQVTPCISYVSLGGAVTPGCCQGVRNLNTIAKTKPDRQAVCGCIKNIVAGISGLKPALLASLPGKCGVSLPYKISPSMDCSKVF